MKAPSAGPMPGNIQKGKQGEDADCACFKIDGVEDNGKPLFTHFETVAEPQASDLFGRRGAPNGWGPVGARTSNEVSLALLNP